MVLGVVEGDAVVRRDLEVGPPGPPPLAPEATHEAPASRDPAPASRDPVPAATTEDLRASPPCATLDA